MPNPLLIIAHRGASGEAIENSRDAFRRAAALGADAVELDVHATADGAFVVHHDTVIPGLGAISDLTAGEIGHHHLANGETIPTLEEAFEAARPLGVWVEVKALPARRDAALLEHLRRAPSWCGVHSFDHRIVKRLSSASRDFQTGILCVARLLDPARALREAGAGVLWQEHTLLDQELVEAVHGAAGTLVAWTVNEDADAARLAGIGVDALCGNYPDQLRRSTS
jgi:glycerophosphoryl diester phosphodiesterase